MTQSFDEWFKENGNKYDYVLPAARDSYEAGQQSRQAEVDELRGLFESVVGGDMKTIDRLKSVIDENNVEIDELQKRIDKALSFTEDVHSENWKGSISCISNILKGTTNEQ